MDFQGPLYDVRMSRGQGYNSYIQEPRLYEAVEIKLQDDSSSATKAEAPISNGIIADANHGQVAPQSSPAPSNNDLVRMIIEEMRKTNTFVPTVDIAKKLPYLKPTSTKKPNQTVLFSSKQVKSATEIDMAMGSKASAAVKAASIGPGAELGSNISTSDDFKGDAINFLVTVKVVNEKPDRPENWNFREVNKLKTRLSSIRCEPCRNDTLDKEHPIIEDHTTFLGNDIQNTEAEYHQVIERERARPACHTCGHKRAIEFTRIYGDTFISDFVEGGEIYALVNIRSSSKTKLKDLKAYASAQLTPAAAPIQLKVDTSFEKSGREAWDQAETSIRVQWRGGGEIKTHDFQWGLDSLIQVANAFPTFVAATSAKIRAVLTPYTALESFQRLQNIFPQHTLTLNYDRCALFVDTLYEDYKAFRSMWDDLNLIIESPEKYIERKVNNKDIARLLIDPTQERRIGRSSFENLGVDAIDQAAVHRSARGSSAGSSIVNGDQATRAQRLLSKLVNKTDPPRRGSILRVLGQRTGTFPTQATIAARQGDSRNTHPQVVAMADPSSQPNVDSAARDPRVSQGERLATPVEVEQSISSVSGDDVPAPGHIRTKRGMVDTSALLLTNLTDILIGKEGDDPKLVPLRPIETQKLSRLRLVCRFAMLHIQDVAANLVLDPQNTGSNFGRRDTGMPMFTEPRYPYPATIRAILPVKPDSVQNKPDYGTWHYTSVEDLQFPNSMKNFPGSPYPDSFTYYWDVFGDSLSNYTNYEYFQIGNFDPANEEYPQAIAFQIHRPHKISSFDRKTRNDENMISGIALRYSDEAVPLYPYNDMENQRLNSGDNRKTAAGLSTAPSIYYDVGAGKPPQSPEQWVNLSWTADSAPFNRFNVYHKQGSGRVSGLEVYRDEEGVDGDAFFDPQRQGVPLISHKAWEVNGIANGKGRTAVPQDYNSVPGDGFSAQKLWCFAGFVGAFEKTGWLRDGRALAKLAVVWKRRASQAVGEEI
jgi:hypothetical protein